MAKRLLLLLNPYAGQRRANKYLPEIIRLYNDRDYECITYVTACSGDATLYLAAHAQGYDRIVCIGGDGTLNETMAGVIEAGATCPVGYVPAGTTNDYARSLGLSGDILQAARDAVDGRSWWFDLGSFNGRNFIYTASCGVFAKVSYTTPQLAKNLLGHAAYIMEGIRDLPGTKPIHICAECEDRIIEGDFLFCAVTNSISVGGVLKLDPEKVRLNDGLFEVMLVRNPVQPSQWTKILMGLSSRELPNEMIEFFTTDRILFEMGEDVEWTLDGERGECGRKFDVINLHRRMKLVLPETAGESVPAEEPGEDEDAAEAKLSD